MSNQTMEREVESAYGSDVFSNSTVITKNENLDIEEPVTKTKMWYQWIKYRIRHYMILETLFFIMLALLLINSYHISSQNEKTYELISNIQKQINDIEKRFELNQDFKKVDLNNQVKLNLEGNESLAEERNNLTSEPTEIDRNTQEKELTKMIKTNTDEEKLLSFQKDHPIFSKICLSFQRNAASYVMGADVDSQKSSDSNLSPFFGRDQSGYVLLDRNELLSHQAWCSDEKKPILTVNLAHYINPIAISYQHFKWNGTIPDGTPKIYDLVACLDKSCKSLEPIVSNCEYKSDGKEEQICPIPPNQNISSVDKVQFHFRENHGNTTRTCVSLIRVYGEQSDKPKEKENPVENAETCSNLAWNYYNRPTIYNWMSKDCKTLYSKNCCTVCPECCRECKIKDASLKGILAGIFAVFIIFSYIACICKIASLNQSKYNNSN